MSDNVKDRVEKMTTTTFSIAGCPLPVFKRFIKFCEENAKVTKVYYNKDGNHKSKEELCYSIGLDRLLTLAEADAKDMMIYDRIIALEDQMAIMMQNRNKSSEEPEKSPFKVFGVK